MVILTKNEHLALTIISGVCSLAAIPAQGLALKYLWGLFIAPQFHMPLLSWPEACGMFVFMALSSTRPTNGSYDETYVFADRVSQCLHPIALAALASGIGCLIHLFM